MKSGGTEVQDKRCRMCLVCGARFTNEWDFCSTECSKDFWAWAHDAERLGQSNSVPGHGFFSGITCQEYAIFKQGGEGAGIEEILDRHATSRSPGRTGGFRFLAHTKFQP